MFQGINEQNKLSWCVEEQGSNWELNGLLFSYLKSPSMLPKGKQQFRVSRLPRYSIYTDWRTILTRR